MTLKADLVRMQRQLDARGPSSADLWWKLIDSRQEVLLAFCDALIAIGPVPPALDRQAGKVLSVYAEVLRIDGFVPREAHPLAQFVAGLYCREAVLPSPFPLALLAAICDPATVQVSIHGCRTCRVRLPERVAEGGDPSFGPFAAIFVACPVCGSQDLGPFPQAMWNGPVAMPRIIRPSVETAPAATNLCHDLESLFS